MAQVAVVPGGAHVLIITRSLIHRIDTTPGRVTTVGRAHIVVIAVLQSIPDALACVTVVTRCAAIAVIAGQVSLDKQAVAFLPTRISGTRIAVAAHHELP